MPNNNQKSLVIAAFAAIYLIWGSTYLGIVLAIQSIPPLLMAAARFLVAGILLLIWGLAKGDRFPDTSSVLRIALSGLLMLFLGNGAVTWGEQYLPSGFVAIIVATVPLWFVLLDRRQWSFYFSNKQIILGLCIGFAGVILLFAGKSATGLFSDNRKLLAFVVLLIGTISWAAGSLYAKYQQMQGSTIMKVAVQMLASGTAFLLSGFIAGEQDGFHFSQITAKSYWAVGYLILMGSLVGYLAYMWLLSVRPASLVGTYAYVNPVVAVFLGWLVVGESVSGQQAIGLAVIIVGLVIVNISKEKKPPTIEVAKKERTLVDS